MPPRKPKSDKPRSEPRANARDADPRFERFAELYVELNGNAHQAALQSGYPASYAKSHGYKLAAQLRLRTGAVLRRYGLDEVYVARKLKKLARAKTPKWNPRLLVRPAKAAVVEKGVVVTAAEPEVRGGWDSFEDAGTQVRALELTVDLLDIRPAAKVKGEGPGGAFPVVLKSSIARPQRPKE
jgi:hypothetical protein